MKILLISDIHANQEGLEACLAVAPEHDAVVNLGDIVGYGGSPNEVTERSRELGGMLVRGNHDKACTGVMGIESFNPIAGLAALWTKQTLKPENLDWLAALPQGPLNMDGTIGVQCVHGSPLDEDEYVIVVRDAVQPLMTTPANVTFFGHTHIQGGFCVEGERWETLRPVYRSKDKKEHCTLELKRNAKYMINPGSAGQPRDQDPRAAFAVFDTETWKVTFHRVPYNVEGAQQKIKAAKLPERLANRLKDGR